MNQPSQKQTPKPVVVTPTFNNRRSVIEVLERVEAVGLGLIVVDDGSTDGAGHAIDQWAAKDRAASVDLVHHPHNQGKAAALRSGFARARELGFTHAASIDTDLQHDPEDLPALLDAVGDDPEALVLGVRRTDLPNTPMRSKIGRWLSNIGIRLAIRGEVSDTQCGLRVYPLALTESVACRSGHYGYETEIIVRAAWRQWRIVQVPITSRYLSAQDRVSHFRPLVDSFRCTALQARLLTRALLPLKSQPNRFSRKPSA